METPGACSRAAINDDSPNLAGRAFLVWFVQAALLFRSAAAAANEAAIPTFRAVEIDSKIEIGYAVTVADVDGDKKPDILVVDKKQIAWYRNPTWEKFLIAENLTPQDNVCIAAEDIDGDGKAEIAVGAGWNPNDTLNSGAVFYLLPPKDRTQKWEPVKLPHEPTVHRMRWMRNSSGRFDLLVVPLHGRGNEGGAGAGVKILAYKIPANPRDSWKTELINGSLHMTHNLDLPRWPKVFPEFLVASREGVFRMIERPDGWKNVQLTSYQPAGSALGGAGEIRTGRLAGRKLFFVTVEPMHGNELVLYTQPEAGSVDASSVIRDRTQPNWPLEIDPSVWNRTVLSSLLKEGHALACGDLLGAGYDQVVIGWRGKNDEGKVGIQIFVPPDKEGKQWQQIPLDDNGMACEDLCLADLNGDGKLDIIASGRATKNVKVYFNEGVK